MAGKRPDQHNIDPGEASATDYKTNPQVGRGNSSRDDTVEGDRQPAAVERVEGGADRRSRHAVRRRQLVLGR